MAAPKQMCCPGLLNRRWFLQAGFLGLAGLSLSDLLRARAASGSGSDQTDTACILVFLFGGPSHLETYDLKPNAPREIRGEFRPIRSRVPGMDVCELLPCHARVADKFALIRSCHHRQPGHPEGTQLVLSGRASSRPPSSAAPPPEFPDVGSVFKHVRGSVHRGLPNYVALPTWVWPAGPAYLGSANRPFEVPADPSSSTFQVPNLTLTGSQTLDRLNDRRRLLGAFDAVRRDRNTRERLTPMDRFRQEAFELLTSARARQAFDLNRENLRLRDQYGRNRFGQTLLLARRLVEAGVGFVAINDNLGHKHSWDDHAEYGNIFQAMKERLPIFDQAVSALVEDIYARGLSKQVLLIVMGEFGRTPKIDYRDGHPGREHWPWAMSILVSGGGLRMGQVIGSTTAKGEHAKDRPLQPCDLLATVYHFLGIDPRQEFRDHLGRPQAILGEGRPIAELLS